MTSLAVSIQLATYRFITSILDIHWLGDQTGFKVIAAVFRVERWVSFINKFTGLASTLTMRDSTTNYQLIANWVRWVIGVVGGAMIVTDRFEWSDFYLNFINQFHFAFNSWLDLTLIN